MHPISALPHGRLGDLEAEFEKLAMDARRTPERVLKVHLANQRS
jgi:hypothetical protein